MEILDYYNEIKSYKNNELKKVLGTYGFNYKDKKIDLVKKCMERKYNEFFRNRIKLNSNEILNKAKEYKTFESSSDVIGTLWIDGWIFLINTSIGKFWYCISKDRVYPTATGTSNQIDREIDRLEEYLKNHQDFKTDLINYGGYIKENFLFDWNDFQNLIQ
jgi:hypothetical protein